MDEKGFIFTTDSILALAIVIVFTASIMTYFYAPIYMGSDHQHLEALADSALNVMEQDGTLTNAAAEAYKGNTSGAEYILNSRLRMLIPGEIAYNLTLTSSNTVSVENDRGMYYSRDTATKVRVLSIPKEGWMGRAWYKIEKFEFEDNQQNVTTTLWNFHNWLTNFAPWSNNNGNLATVGKWGASGSSPYSAINIQFSFPNGATILGGKYLSGSCIRNTSGSGSSFGTNLTVNSQIYQANANQYTFLYRRPSQNYPMFNYQGNLNVSNLNVGVNNFNLKYLSPIQNYIDNNRQGHDMPWFSIIGNYTTSFPVPAGIISQTFRFNEGAGMAVQTAQDLDGNGVANEYGRRYYLNNGTVDSFTNLRRIAWGTFVKSNQPTYQDGQPFVITGASGMSGTTITPTKCAVSTTSTIYVPNGNVIFDAFTVINPYGGVDGALVEVYNGTTWQTVFCSFDYDGTRYSDGTDLSGDRDGYGNIPGIISIPTNYLSTGRNNTVRVTIWDDVPSSDYDLVGLVDGYTTVTYSALNIGWVNSYFRSFQDNDNFRTETKAFSIDEDAKNAYLFVGVGLDSRHIRVNYPSGVLYDSDTIPYYLDLAALDAAGAHYITTANSTPSNYYLKPGNYQLTVSVTGPPSNQQWQSGDWRSNAEIFSGTRISIIYPEVLRNVWTIDYNETATGAMNAARDQLISNMNITDPDIINSIKTEALFTGDFPNQVPVRLSLWRQ